MPTSTEILRLAQKLAEDNGSDWQDNDHATRNLYIQAALTKLSSTSVVFPTRIKSSYCTVASSSRLLMTPHGAIRVTLQLDARAFYVCRTSEGDRVYPGISMAFADQPCGPNCVNR
jgi:hypothetical protein